MGNWYKCREIIEARNPEDRAREERVPVQEQSSPLGKKMESRGREWGAVETGNKPLPSPMGGGKCMCRPSFCLFGAVRSWFKVSTCPGLEGSTFLHLG